MEGAEGLEGGGGGHGAGGGGDPQSPKSASLGRSCANSDGGWEEVIWVWQIGACEGFWGCRTLVNARLGAISSRTKYKS